MTNAERAKRFRMARTELNRHGTETQAQVYAAANVSASAISNLENPESSRVPSADLVNTLAEYYGVNAAWLTGQSESWSLNKDSQALTKVLGFSPKAADKLTRLMADAGYRNAVNSLLESDRFDRMLSAVVSLSDMPRAASAAFSLSEEDMQAFFSWKAEREMNGLLQEIMNR